MSKPLIVRLPNWVGDVVMAVPALRLLEAHGYELHLVGKRWAGPLLAGEPWSVTEYGARWRDRVPCLRRLAVTSGVRSPGVDRGEHALVFPTSFSSAWEMWCARLGAFGYRRDARRFLLARSVTLPHDVHQLRIYWQLVTAFLGIAAEPPAHIDLKVAGEAQVRARELVGVHGLRDGYIVLCPFVIGLYRGVSRRWPHFGELARRLTSELRLPVVVCPGPAEQAEARAMFSGAAIVNDIDLGSYAAMLQRASLVVANDTGPGHMAAALGVPLISVLGPTDPTRTGPWGGNVTFLKKAAGWPTVTEVIAASRAILGQQTG